MKELPRDIEVALNMLNDVYFQKYPRNYGKIYIRTNEALSIYYDKFKLDGAKVLTVAGSGDHILQAVYSGAKEVDAFDKNRFQIYLIKLKLAALKTLSQDEFAYFFGFRDPSEIFDLNIYLKIREELDLDSLIFWDTLYQSGNLKNNKSRFIFLQFFIDSRLRCFAFDENYYVTRDNLERVDVRLHHATFHDFISKLSDSAKYDAVFMSNITDYFSNEQFTTLTNFLDDKVQPHLTEHGQVAVYAPPHKKDIEFEEYTGQDEMVDVNKVYIYNKK